MADSNFDLSLSKSNFTASEKVTAVVGELARRAARILNEGSDGRIMVNAYGIFSDPHKRRAELQSARDQINQAIEFMDAAPWPKEADYNRL